MAKMIGDIIRSTPGWSGNNGYERRRSSIRRNEDTQWSEEAFEEIEDPEHADVLCSDPKTGMVGCDYCYPDYDWLPNGFAEDLDDIEGVTTNMERL